MLVQERFCLCFVLHFLATLQWPLEFTAAAESAGSELWMYPPKEHPWPPGLFATARYSLHHGFGCLLDMCLFRKTFCLPSKAPSGKYPEGQKMSWISVWTSKWFYRPWSPLAVSLHKEEQREQTWMSVTTKYPSKKSKVQSYKNVSAQLNKGKDMSLPITE